MSINFEVENLGKITSGNFRLSNMTVVTGPNGTGKSFFTKFLYSIFATVENFTVWGHTRNTLNNILDTLNDVINDYDDVEEYAILLKERVEYLIENQFSPHSSPGSYIEEQKLLKSLHPESLFLNEYFIKEFSNYIKLPEKELREEHINIYYLQSSFEVLPIFTSDDTTTYQYFIARSLGSELKKNFQIESLNELIQHGKDEVTFNFNSSIDITIKRDVNTVKVALKKNAIDFFRNKPKSVFFESPAYWRVRDALIEARLNTQGDYLSGVPKYFFDLDKALRLKSISNEGLEDIFENIKNELGGEFEITGNDIVFNENTGVSISKNLVSFGMTNIGMLNALIKNNVIRCGSYVFIDEPETNLHPDWQLLMIDSLIKLSKRGVKVIINTHSIEILKHIENSFKELSQDILAVNYVDVDGETYEFESEIPWEQTAKARENLSGTYFNLYMNGI
ncbi:AAA family ATPase [Vibrio alginolyticus]